MKFVCVGHATYDILLPLDKFPIENSRNYTDRKIECGGGPAATAAYLLAKWNMKTTFVGVVGNDHYGTSIIKEFNEIGVNTDYIEKNNDFETDVSYIIASKERGSRTVITSKKNKIPSLYEPVNIDDADVILLDAHHPITAKEILLKNPNAISILDASHVNEDTYDLGKMVNYFICSKEYAENFTKIKIDYNNFESLIAIYETLNMHFKTNILITLEEHGVFTKLEEYVIIPSIRVNTVDSTGAGDIFHGAFAYFIANKYNIKAAIKYANIAGALSTTKVGSRNAIVDSSEILKCVENVELL